MFNSYNKHLTKPKTVFLDVKPAFVNPRFSGLNNRKDSIALYGTDTRPSLASVTSLENFQKDVLFSNIGASYSFMRCLGAMPVTRRSPGNAVFSMASIAFAYSVLFFVILIIYVGYVAENRIKIVSSLKGPFEEAVIAYLFLVNILPILLIPIIWSETSKVAQLLNDWNDFEILYFQISGHSVPLKIRKKALGITIALPILSIVSVVITHITMADFHIMQVIPYCILDNLTAMLGAWWYLSCEALSDTANILAERFQKALRHIGPAAMVADYRSLWLRLSKLTRDTGTATCYTFTFLNLYLFFIITLSIYGLMSQLSEGFGIKDIGLAITAIWSICLLFFICDEAHYASHNVRTNFQKKLLMVELSWMNSDAQTEINMFLRATEMNPSNINCGGFFDVNRNLFKGVIPYCILDNLTAMLGAWWYLSCEALSDTANILAERFQKALRHIGPAAMVADYRSLWLRLSKLTRDTGTATCYTFTFLNLYLFFIITLSIYGLMSQLSEGFGIKDIGLAITAIWSICLLFFICDEAHYASHNVRTNFQKKLLMVELSWMNSDAQTEINMFLRATEMNPSNINCGGFFDVNRNLFKGLLTTMVTYLVVLLQFQISIPDGKPRGNFTFGVGSLLNGTDVVVSLISH